MLHFMFKINIYCCAVLGETGTSCMQGQVVTESFYEDITHMESPSTIVVKFISGHTVEKP